MKHAGKKRVSLLRWISGWVVALTLMAHGVTFGIAYLDNKRMTDRLMAGVPQEVVQEIKALQDASYENPEGDHSRLVELYKTWLVDRFVQIDAAYDVTWRYPSLILLSLVPVLLGGLWFSHRLSSQLNSVTVAAREIAQGRFAARARAEKRAPQALVVLREDFNHMAERLERYDRELQISSAAMAHELRTPLTAAKGRVQALTDGVFPADAHQLSVIMRQLDQIDRLVTDLYLLSLASAGQLVLETGEFNVRALVDERLGWLAQEMERRNVRVDVHMDDDLLMRADRDRIGQVVSIVLDNALRYGADGGWIGVRGWQDGGSVMLSVEDAGSGFPEADIDRVCDRFWRAERSRSRHKGGGGLGLAVAAAICSAHGGRFSVLNREEGGARVVIDIPGHEGTLT
ncbi:MAG: HAMP domain-containing sensor histidine kinase [Lautropia sp.]|nr:HAMP domain-containing sensor histidine kinase [Lautropia sp.]